MAGRRKSKFGGSADLAIGILILFVIGFVITYWKTILLVLLIVGISVSIYFLAKYLLSRQKTQNSVQKTALWTVQQNAVVPPQNPPNVEALTKTFKEPVSVETVKLAEKSKVVQPRTNPVHTLASMTPEEVEIELNRLEKIVRT